MGSTPQISVVIPTYGRESSLARAVVSVLRQTMGDLELIVVDDRSDPPITLPNIADPRLRIIRHDRRQGAAAARNTGVAAAQGEFIAFLDSDDWWAESKLQKQLAAAEEAGGWTAIGTGWRYLREDYSTSESFLPVASDDLALFAAGCWFCPGSTVLLRRDVVNAVGPQDPTLPRLEDYDWYLRFAKAGGCLVVVPEPLATIAWTRHTNVDAVARSTAALRQKYGHPGMLLPREMRRMKAYLLLSEAGPAWYAGHRLRAIRKLLGSVFYRPRSRLQVEDWWRRGN